MVTSFEKFKVVSLRLAYRLLAAANWLTAKPPYDIRIIDIEIPLGDGIVLKGKVFEPSYQFASQNPMIIHFHGGGMCLGSCETTHHYALLQYASLLKCTIVSVDYRLAPEHPFPAGADDAVASCNWIQEHCAEKYPCNGRFVVMGDSSGGYCAVLCCLRSKKPLDGAILFYPVVDSANNSHESYKKYAKGHNLTLDMMLYFFNSFLGKTCSEFEDENEQNEDRLLKAFPGKTSDATIAERMPKTFLVTCVYDILQDEAKRLAGKIKDVETQHYVAEHGFMATLGKNDNFMDCMEKLGTWMKAFKK